MALEALAEIEPREDRVMFSRGFSFSDDQLEDPTHIQQGRLLAEAGLKLLNEHHLAQLTGDPTALKNAIQEYGEAEKSYLAWACCG